MEKLFVLQKAHRKMCFIRGRKGFDGGSEVWAAGSSGGTAL